MRLRVSHQHLQLWPILAHFVDYYSLFWFPKASSSIDDPLVCLRVRRQHSQFCPILAVFMDYYSPFWGTKGISTIDDPRGAFTCTSSKLTVLANSDPFRGLLLTVLGS